MRYLNRPKVDDLESITTISSNNYIPPDHKLVFNSIKAHLKPAYKAYLRARGCPHILPIPVTPDQKKRLISLYSTESSGLEFIDGVRHRLSPEVCPMCGKPGNGGEVDHLLEKNTHPEFSFFSANLVPACKCNGKRRVCMVGGAKVRPLHPYFDKVLRRRLISAKYSGDFENPNVKIVSVGGLGPYKARVDAHILSVVIPNGIDVWIAKQWELLLLLPHRHLMLMASPSSEDQLRDHLLRLRDRADGMYGSLNGWEAAWLSGLIRNPRAIKGVFMLLNGTPVAAIPAI